jgi:hypothetical protein
MDLIKKDEDGTLNCGFCLARLQLQDKVIGLQQRKTFDLYWCPLCTRLYWLPPQSGSPRNRIRPHLEVIDG